MSRQSVLKARRATRRARHAPHGVAAVEFAVIAPLFLLLLAGIVEFGQAFRIEHSLSTAARHGARAATIDGATTSQIVEKVRNHCASTLSVTPADVTVEVSVNGNPNAALSQAYEQDEISVNVQIPYAKAGVGFFAHMFADSTLNSTCTLEHE